MAIEDCPPHLRKYLYKAIDKLKNNDRRSSNRHRSAGSRSVNATDKTENPGKTIPSSKRKAYSFCALGIPISGNQKSIYEGYNSYTKTHPAQYRFAEAVGEPDRCYLHAEIDCLRKARYGLWGIFIARIDKQGNPAPAAPCAVCRAAIEESGVSKVYYT